MFTAFLCKIVKQTRQTDTVKNLLQNSKTNKTDRHREETKNTGHKKKERYLRRETERERERETETE